MGIAENIERLFMSRLEKMQPLPALQESLNANHKQVAEINHHQMMDGLDANGKKIEKYKKYSIKHGDHVLSLGARLHEQYAEFKHRYNSGRPGWGTPDYLLEGHFFESFILKIDLKETKIDATDWKRNFLVSRAPKNDIFGIQQKNMPLLANVIKPDFIQRVKQQIGIR